VNALITSNGSYYDVFSIIVGVALYLVCGMLWANIFIGLILDDRSWGDGTPVGPFGATMITICWPVMAALVGVIYAAAGIIWCFTDGVRKMYGLKPKDNR
jgi:hypothetical protein